MLALLVLALVADPTPPIVTVVPPSQPSMPVEVQARPGRAVRLTAESAGKVTRWELADTTTADLIPSADGQTAAFVAPTPGRYLVLAYTAAGDTPSAATRVVIAVGDAPPVPPVPPPVPPTPPKPDDPLTQRIRTAYQSDAGDPATKADALALLAELHRQASTLARDPAILTAAELARRVGSAASALAADAIPHVRAICTAEVLAVMPADRSAPLTPEARTALADTMTRLAAGLSAAK